MAINTPLVIKLIPVQLQRKNDNNNSNNNGTKDKHIKLLQTLDMQHKSGNGSHEQQTSQYLHHIICIKLILKMATDYTSD